MTVTELIKQLQDVPDYYHVKVVLEESNVAISELVTDHETHSVHIW